MPGKQLPESPVQGRRGITKGGDGEDSCLFGIVKLWDTGIPQDLLVVSSELRPIVGVLFAVFDIRVEDLVSCCVACPKGIQPSC